jgi:hypothetical protein
MTAVEIIEEIKRMPRAEQNRVMEFVRTAGESGALAPDQLGELAKQMAEAKDPVEADRLQAEIVRGFYGRPADLRIIAASDVGLICKRPRADQCEQ